MFFKGKCRSGKYRFSCMVCLVWVVTMLTASYGYAQIPVPGCQEVTPTLTVKPASFRCKEKAGESCEIRNWVARGQFTMFTGPDRPFDPDSQHVSLVFNQLDGDVYRPELPEGSFEQMPPDYKPGWVFRLSRTAADVEGAEGLRLAKFRHAKLVPASGMGNRVKYTLRGKGTEGFVVDTSGSPILLRQTFIFSEPEAEGGEELLCVSYVLTCLKRGNGRILRCFSSPLSPSPSGAFLEVTNGAFD